MLRRISPCAVGLVAAQSFIWLMLLLLEGFLSLARHPLRWTRALACSCARKDATLVGLARTTVVIVGGGGFGGLAALHELSSHPNVQVVLIDQRDFFEYTPGVLRLFCDTSIFNELARNIPQGSHEFVHGVVTAVNSDHVEVVDQSGQARKVQFDYLILATGADYRQPITATAGESTLALRQATWRKEATRLKAAESVLILGGGAVGTELAAEIVCHFPKKRVTIVDALPHLVPLFPYKTVLYVEKWFRDRGVELLLEQRLERWDEEGCWIKDGRAIKADIVFVCFGMRCNSQSIASGDMADCLGHRKEVRVNEHLQVEGRPCIFAIGDVMSNPTGEIKQAYYAEMNGTLAARNVLQHLAGKPLLKFPDDMAGSSMAPLVYVVSLGRYDGSLGFNKLVVNGPISALLKWFIEWTKVRQMEGRPVGQLIWAFGDSVTFFLSRFCFKPKKGTD